MHGARMPGQVTHDHRVRREFRHKRDRAGCACFVLRSGEHTAKREDSKCISLSSQLTNKKWERNGSALSDSFGAYIHDSSHHPDVTVHHGGPTLAEGDGTVNGLLLVLEAPSIDTARAFVAGSPYAQAGTFAEAHIRPWNWLTGRPD